MATTKSFSLSQDQANSGGAVPPFTAGKNRIINGDFGINQRNFTTASTDGTFGFDRWLIYGTGGTRTWTSQTFTPGTAPVAGYEGTNFSRLVTSGQSAAGDYFLLGQRIEDVRTFANQTVTCSFWAKASSGTPKVAVATDQSFGSGGSATVTTAGGNVTISTSWARYSVTFTIPSVSGKTIGAGSNCGLLLFTSAGSSLSAYTNIGVQNATIDIWGVQLEAGSVATPFTTATGTIQGELAACQRYYWRVTPSGASQRLGVYAITGNTTTAVGYIQFPVPMRTAPTSVDSNGLLYATYTGSQVAMSSVAFNEASSIIAQIYGTISSTTAGVPGSIQSTNSSSYLGFSAEL